MNGGFELTEENIERWLRCEDASVLEKLWNEADRVRRENVGDEIHLRGLVEFSNHCERSCLYCGIRRENSKLERYIMPIEEILACARDALSFGYRTVVLQAGESPARIEEEYVSEVVRRIKDEVDVAVTLSLGERTPEELESWRKAGADRYLLRIETSDLELFSRIHPGRDRRLRTRLLDVLRELGYEVGTGIMIGIPGQSYRSIAHDILFFRKKDVDMIGVGPFIAHPDTPLGREEVVKRFLLDEGEQVPPTEEMTYKVLALCRIACPEANIPSTTALATLNLARGRELGLQRGANVVMPNLTPTSYRKLYEIYPSKACIRESAGEYSVCIRDRIRSIGRPMGTDHGDRRRRRKSGPGRTEDETS